MNYINDFHWICYGLGFIFAPRFTIMIALSLYLGQFIPLSLMIIGWVFIILNMLCGGNAK